MKRRGFQAGLTSVSWAMVPETCGECDLSLTQLPGGDLPGLRVRKRIRKIIRVAVVGRISISAPSGTTCRLLTMHKYAVASSSDSKFAFIAGFDLLNQPPAYGSLFTSSGRSAHRFAATISPLTGA